VIESLSKFITLFPKVKNHNKSWSLLPIVFFNKKNDLGVRSKFKSTKNFDHVWMQDSLTRIIQHACSNILVIEWDIRINI
jgi:hypothetical protein